VHNYEDGQEWIFFDLVGTWVPFVWRSPAGRAGDRAQFKNLVSGLGQVKDIRFSDQICKFLICVVFIVCIYGQGCFLRFVLKKWYVITSCSLFQGFVQSSMITRVDLPGQLCTDQ
jgi:hypothetical protein